jgi:predicted ATPase
MLVVLDNVEQVVDAAPGLADLLAACPGLALLATGRECLHLRAEVEHVLSPLEADDAARLFHDRARAQGSVVDAESDEVRELCRRLDALPLAIELAAARTRLFSPGELVARLGAQLALLTGGPRDAPERHRTLATTIDWS